jgi:hypothetical protein
MRRSELTPIGWTTMYGCSEPGSGILFFVSKEALSLEVDTDGRT